MRDVGLPALSLSALQVVRTSRPEDIDDLLDRVRDRNRPPPCTQHFLHAPPMQCQAAYCGVVLSLLHNHTTGK